MNDKLGQNILSIIKTWMEENQADWPNDFALKRATNDGIPVAG